MYVQGRGALYYAVSNGNEELIKMLLKRDNCDVPDTLWVSDRGSVLKCLSKYVRD